MGEISPIKTVIGGISALIIVMGIGRFAYTPILPLMQNDGMFGEQAAGYLASANYFGYLLGAIFASKLAWRRGKLFYLHVYLAVSFMTTLAMGMTEHWFIWGVLRTISGVASGLVFVFASSIVIDILNKYRRLTWVGFFYSGVGIGIFISGLLTPAFHFYFSWKGAWIGMGIVAAMIWIFVIKLLKEAPMLPLNEKKEAADIIQPLENDRLKWFIAAYTCEGIGYIVSATFLVALVQEIPSLRMFPSLSWVLVGLAAAPSCFIWANMAIKWGNFPTLKLAFFLQIIGVVLPVVFPHAFGALIGSLLFGATFMGITTLFMTEAKNIISVSSSYVIGYLTFFYGLGQMIGPAVAGILIAETGGYARALYFASIVLFFGMIFIHFSQPKKCRQVMERVP